MYRTCGFCNGKLGGDGGPSGLGVGRRLAFDEWKGRLWVICPKCSRWNLAPLDDRLEQIEALARAANSGSVAAATEQVALIRWQSYDLVRVGKPRRMEFATWRYGERLKARRREQLKFVVPVTVGAVARRELTLRSLGAERRLALEMAVDERAEVEDLERHWQEAEEIAEIADGMLSTTTDLEEELRRLKQRQRPKGDQPSS